MATTGEANLSGGSKQPTSGENSEKNTTEATKRSDLSKGPLSNKVTSAKSLEEDTKRTGGPGTVINGYSTAKNTTEATKPSGGASREVDGSGELSNHSMMTTTKTSSSAGSKVPASEDHSPTKGATQATRPEGLSTSDRSEANSSRKDSKYTGNQKTTIRRDSTAESATEGVQPSEGTGTPRKSDDSGMRTIEETKLAGDHSNAKNPTKATTRIDHSGGSPAGDWSPTKVTRMDEKYTNGLGTLIGRISTQRHVTKLPEHRTESYDYNYDYNYTYHEISSARRTTESAEHSEGSEKPFGSRESPTKNTTESTYHTNVTFNPGNGDRPSTKRAAEATSGTLPSERFAKSTKRTNNSIETGNSQSEYATEVTVRADDSEDSRSGTHPTARQPTEATEDRGGYEKSGMGHFTISSGTEAHRYAASEAHTDGLRRNTTDKDEVRTNGRGGDAEHSTTSFSAVEGKQKEVWGLEIGAE
nr:extracellular matrix protein papilin 3 [Haemonchus contortus]